MPDNPIYRHARLRAPIPHWRRLALICLGGWQAFLPLSVRAAELGLSYRQAVERALKVNVRVILASQATERAQAKSLQARSPLLPHLSVGAQQAHEEVSLVELGLSPALLHKLDLGLTSGPFYSFEARLRLTQTIFDREAIFQARRGREEVELARLQEQEVHEQLASSVGIQYVAVLRARRAVLDAEANVKLSKRLLLLAQRQREAGTAMGLDEVRADTRLAQLEVRLEQAKAATNQAELGLKHSLEMPMGDPLALTDDLEYVATKAPALALALEHAHEHRIEYQVLQKELLVSQLELKAAGAEYDPVVQVSANFGVASDSAFSPYNQPVHSVALQVGIPLYNGGLSRGRVMEAETRCRDAEVHLADLNVTVDQDVRNALDSLQTSARQVESAHQIGRAHV